MLKLGFCTSIDSCTYFLDVYALFLKKFGNFLFFNIFTNGLSNCFILVINICCY